MKMKMRIRQAAAKCNLSALRRGLRWRWERGRRAQGWALGWGCLSSSDAAPRGTVWFTVNRRLKKTQERDRERVGEKEWERGGRNLNVISKKWIKNLCGGTKQPIEGWFIAQRRGVGRYQGLGQGFGFTKLSCNTWQVFIYAPQSESQREEV